MCALYPLLPNWTWPSVDHPLPLDHHQEDNHVNYYRDDHDTLDSIFHLPISSSPVFEPDRSSSFTANNLSSCGAGNGGAGDGEYIVKKLNHNASERDRRKKLNTLYYSLRSLLPLADQKKKLSIPATVSRVVKYIPELQREMEKLVKKKEELSRRIDGKTNMNEEINTRGDGDHHDQMGGIVNGSKPSILASWVNDKEVALQISTLMETPLSSILLSLEQEFGLLLLTASSFQSFGGRLFCNLHLQMDRSNYNMESEVLRQKLLCFVTVCQKKEN